MSEWKRVTLLSKHEYGEECIVSNKHGAWVHSIIGLDGEFYDNAGCQKVDVIPCFYMIIPPVPEV